MESNMNANTNATDLFQFIAKYIRIKIQATLKKQQIQNRTYVDKWIHILLRMFFFFILLK